MQQRIQRTAKPTAARAEHDEYCRVLQCIAWGKPNANATCPYKPFNGEEARQMAREVLVRHGVNWPEQKKGEVGNG